MGSKGIIIYNDKPSCPIHGNINFSFSLSNPLYQPLVNLSLAKTSFKYIVFIKV